MSLTVIAEEVWVSVSSIDVVHERQARENHYLNGIFQAAASRTTSDRLAHIGDTVVFCKEESIVEMVAKLDDARPLVEPGVAPDRDHYLVVQCFNTKHRRVNDVLANDPMCKWCRGLGIVRVHRDHVPILRRMDADRWAPAETIVDQIGDLS